MRSFPGFRSHVHLAVKKYEAKHRLLDSFLTSYIFAIWQFSLVFPLTRRPFSIRIFPKENSYDQIYKIPLKTTKSAFQRLSTLHYTALTPKHQCTLSYVHTPLLYYTDPFSGRYLTCDCSVALSPNCQYTLYLNRFDVAP